MRITNPTTLIILALMALLLTAVGASGAEVSIDLSSRVVSVGAPFTLNIEITNANDFDEPVLPEMKGIRVLGPPVRQSSTTMSIVNGRAQQRRTVIFTYDLVADELGSAEIPAITVRADGKLYGADAAIPITVVDSGDPSLLAVEVVALQDRVYLGQSIDLILRIYVRPYQDRSLPGPIDSRSMWSSINVKDSTWGPFADTINRLINAGTLRPRPLSGVDSPHPDPANHEGSYYLYEVATSVWPERAGEHVVNPVSLLMDYPLKIERIRRGFDTGRLGITQSRAVVARAEMPQIVVDVAPPAGRPDVYSGAVGRFAFDVTARPTEVAVGDPITITLRVTDRTRGGVQMDLLQPPLLDAVPDLTAGFRWPSDPLAGVVAGRMKSFSQTIRARSSDVSEIPAIPFAFFDPAEEKYVTVYSDPIPITVTATTSVSMGDIVGGELPENGQASELTEVSRGLRGNVKNIEALVALTTPRSHGWLWALVLGLPAVAGAALIGHRQAVRLRTDTLYARRRRAMAAAVKRIDAAQGGSVGEQAEAASSALTDYIADRCGRPAGGLTPDEAVHELAQHGISNDLIDESKSILAECQQAVFAAAGTTVSDIGQRTRAVIASLERERMA